MGTELPKYVNLVRKKTIIAHNSEQRERETDLFEVSFSREVALDEVEEEWQRCLPKFQLRNKSHLKKRANQAYKERYVLVR